MNYDLFIYTNENNLNEVENILNLLNLNYNYNSSEVENQHYIVIFNINIFNISSIFNFIEVKKINIDKIEILNSLF